MASANQVLSPVRIALLVCVALVAIADWRLIASSFRIYYTQIGAALSGVEGPTLRETRLSVVDAASNDVVLQGRAEAFENATIPEPPKEASGDELAVQNAASFEAAFDTPSGSSYLRRRLAAEEEEEKKTKKGGADKKKKQKTIPWDSVPLVIINFRPFRATEIQEFPFYASETLTPSDGPRSIVQKFQSHVKTGNCAEPSKKGAQKKDGEDKASSTEKKGTTAKKTEVKCPFTKHRTGLIMLWIGVGFTFLAITLALVAAYLDLPKGWMFSGGAALAMVIAGICLFVAFNSEKTQQSHVLVQFLYVIYELLDGAPGWVSEPNHGLFTRYLDYMICLIVSFLGFAAIAAKGAMDDPNCGFGGKNTEAGAEDQAANDEINEASQTLLNEDQDDILNQ